jgi:hypothetical protein
MQMERNRSPAKRMVRDFLMGPPRFSKGRWMIEEHGTSISPAENLVND